MTELNQFSARFLFEREVMRPSLRTWIKHALLFLLTLVTATMAGVFQPFGRETSPLFLLEYFFSSSSTILFLPVAPFFIFISALGFVFSDGAILLEGLKFSVSLLFILTAHEFGHYIACRIYRVDATLPFFIPLPLASPAGTLGAFIKILSPMPSRRATFDIGVAGPIAGFLALIPVAILGFMTWQYAGLSVNPSAAEMMGFTLSDPLLMKLLAWIIGVDLSIPILSNPFYAAAWVGLLVTALNLFPSGQLDGGHAVYAVFGEKIHRLTGRIAFVVMVVLTFLGLYLYNSPSGLLFTVLLGVMMRLRHPEPIIDEPLDRKRKLIALFTLIIFILSFAPFPIQVQ